MHRIHRAALVPLLVLAASLPACREKDEGLVEGTGTIGRYAVDCSSWNVTTGAGRDYELTSLPSEFQQVGLRVRFVLRLRPDRMSTCMAGPIADVVSITRS